jgi:uncharacterized protein
MKVAPVAELKASPFDLGDVRLLDGPFKTAMELNARYLLSLEPDRLLADFRKNAGLDPKASAYGGWEAEGVAGHSLGHYLTAIAQQYRATRDPRFLERVNYIVAELAECQAKDRGGYVAAIPGGKAIFDGLKARGGAMQGWVPWYTMHKLLAGLRDAYLLCDNQQAKVVLIRLADWTHSATQELTDAEMETMLGMEHGGMPEVLGDVYAVTGDPKYLVLARRFCHRFVMDPLARGDDRLTGLHANTQIPKITGAARLYELTGEDYFASVARNFWSFVVTNRSYVIGGNSDSEHFFPPEETGRHLSSATCETCNTYNMLKLTEHVFAWQPSAFWMDYYERALYNQILASQDPRTGMFTYFIPLKPGHFKTYSNPTNSFWCCVGTGMENHTKYGAAIYAHSTGTLWVNLFIPSEVNWRDQGVTVRQETSFPESDTTRLTISCKQPLKFALRVRAPFWLAAPVLARVNGQEVPVHVEKDFGSSGYFALDREWRDGDRLELRLPMALRTEFLSHTTNQVAILYGPALLAAELGTEGLDGLNLYQDNHNENLYRNLPAPVTPVYVAGGGDLIKNIEAVPAKPLNFRTRHLVQPRDVTLIPFWKMHHQRYAVYLQSFTPDGWTRYRAEMAAAEERKRAFEARIVDDVQPGEQQSEVDHAFKGEKTSSGGSDPKWRDARDGGWFEYTLLALPGRPFELSVTYWGSDSGGREFDILVEGQKVGTEKLEGRHPQELFKQSYVVTGAMTEGKSRVVVRFQAHPGKMAGGVFGLRLLRPE